ncbi:AMP-dependent synthetase/ligase [Candidatus Omnitrophota bacterium]
MILGREYPDKAANSTINEMWLNSAAAYRDKSAFCVRNSEAVESADHKIDEIITYSHTTYSQMESLVTALGAGLAGIGLKDKDAVGVISENCIRWMVCDLAVLGNRAYNVPRGTASTIEEIEYILKFSETEIAVLENENELTRVLKIRERLPKLKSLIVLDENYKSPKDGRGIYSFDDLIEIGRKASAEDHELFNNRRRETRPSDLATLIFTSGTTGTPKGIPLTHGNIMANANVVPFMLNIDSSHKFLSVLPIWHIFERTVQYVAIRVGASKWYTSSLTILKDLAVVEPEWMVSVPRVWISVYNGVMKNIQRSGREKLFKKFYGHSLKVVEARRYKENRQYLLDGEQAKEMKASLIDNLFHRMGDALIYSKVRGKLGSNFIAGISGGGSLPEYIDDFFEVIGVKLIDGYGLTETSPVLSMRTLENLMPYTAGRPLPDTGIRILDDNGSEVKNGEKGVVWACGAQVMEGYYKNPEETNKVMKKDKENRTWFNTGDLARRTKSGDITILGRVKDTIVLISGENVEPVKIERALLKSEYVDQVMVCGQDQEYLTALIAPNEELLESGCEKLGIRFDKDNIPKLMEDKDIKGLFVSIINKSVCKSKGFEEIEFIHNIAFVKPFVPEDDTLTNSLKIKRHKVRKRDHQAIKGMYPNYNESGKVKRG